MPLDAQPTVKLERAEAVPFPDRNGLPCGRFRGWIVCYTHPQAERWADSQLRLRGYRTYLPLVIVRRRDNAIRSLYHRVELPAFARYLFVHLDTPWTPVRYCPGVADLVWNEPGKPGTVAEAEIQALRGALDEAATQPPDRRQWAPGALCALGNGPLAGHPAVVLATNRDTATLGVMLFGALRQVQAPIAWLTERS